MKIFKGKNELIIKKNEIETIPVRDLKDYLVKDFEQIENDAIEIQRLKDRIEELEKTEIKYKATLVTLEEFDSRVEREKEKNEILEEKNRKANEEVKQLNEKVNNCTIREKQALEKMNDVKGAVLNEYKEKLRDEIKNYKGNLSKAVIYNIIDYLR